MNMGFYRLSFIRYFPGLPHRELGKRTHRVVESAVVHAVVGDDVPVLFCKEEKKEDAAAHASKNIVSEIRTGFGKSLIPLRCMN